MHSSSGASAYGATGKNGNSAAVGETANGDKYAAANGKTYSNTGSGWDQKSGFVPAAGAGRKRAVDHLP